MFSRTVFAIAAVGYGRAFAETAKVCANAESCADSEEQEAADMKTSLLQLNSRNMVNVEEMDEPETKTKDLCSDSCPPGMCQGLEQCQGCSWCEMLSKAEEMQPEHKAAIAEAPKEQCMSFCTVELCESEPKRCGGCDTCVEGTGEDEEIPGEIKDDTDED
eukprot:TRINITY_DN1667_c0_g2_i1.p1 TRINITY_DN1667_c0_g2~~TRINITY_DN1667_c0_g2_i1.p1  ORF type:complete len:161 (-),score=51.14 TRINITY_DN1667_c0_g2_i1:136-618(-)